MNSKLAALAVALSMVIIISAVAIGSDDADGTTIEVQDQSSLTSAISSADTGDTIKLSEDITLTDTLN